MRARFLFITFYSRGSSCEADWKDNLRTAKEDGSSVKNLITGRFHAGFLSRASAFPAEKILSDDRFKDCDVVVCGHSLGGAVATIVTILLSLDLERRRKAGADDRRSVLCVTFGAPFVGDEELKDFCDSRTISGNIFNFVNNQVLSMS